MSGSLPWGPGISFFPGVTMNRAAKNYYLFLGFHSFLLGLFPFFLPVYLYKNGAGLQEISWFIAITGITFSLTLFCLDYLRQQSYITPLFLSFVLEICLLGLLVSGAPLWVVGIVNGAYNCLFWTLQRILFLSGGSEKNSGKRFGNFQIYVLVVLKAGILCGSMLLEQGGIVWVCFLSVAIACTGAVFFLGQRGNLRFPDSLISQEPLGIRGLIRYKDKYRSREIFAVDGVFLYLESYFWVISLFLMVGESFIKLGGIVVLLAIILGLIFFVIKNRIDSVDKQKMYRAGVAMYSLSWIFRAVFDAELSLETQVVLLLTIAFCTSFFRLTFNKRFFDLAKWSGENRYLFVKSHYSQFFIGVSFALLGSRVCSFEESVVFLKTIYWGAAICSVLYLLYRCEKTVSVSRVEERLTFKR